jgi:hypothetical protein
VDTFDIDGIRLLARNPRIHPHPLGWTVMDAVDGRLQFGGERLADHAVRT